MSQDQSQHQLQHQSERSSPEADELEMSSSTSSSKHNETSRLNRRLSAPARFKITTTSKLPNGLQDKEAVEDVISTETRCNQCDANQLSPFRHSHKDRSHHHAHNHHHHQNYLAHSHSHRHHRQRPIVHHKSASPLSSSSSSASDSAFSHSQTTIGSENGEHSLASASAKVENKCPASDCKLSNLLDGNNLKSVSDTDKLNYPNNGDDADDTESTTDDDTHFKIVWQNLCYRVKEKKLTKLANKLNQIYAHYTNNKGDHSSGEEATSQTISGQKISHVYESNDGRPGGADDCHGQTSDELSMRRPIQNKQRQVIFSNLNGCVKSGELTAILGPSGAGKTTFLKCLTNSVVDGVTGSINILGGLKTKKKHLKLCIIPQKDYLFDNLSVMENLLFASRIKNTQKDFNHKENVIRVAGLLGLNACLKLKSSRLSGGQYKRVSIAQELLSQPDILILDEPTSGLDSLTCFRTVSVLKELADLSKKGALPPMAILITIHQPQIKIFNLFHHVYILSSMGQCVYEGKPNNLLETVSGRCNLRPPLDDQNPASFIIDLASEIYGPLPISKLVELQHDNFSIKHKQMLEANSQHCTLELESSKQNSATNSRRNSVIPSLVTLSTPKDFKPGNATSLTSSTPTTPGLYISERLRKRNNHNQSFWLHTSLLIKRLWISMWRDSLLTTTRVVFHVMVPFIFYFVYSHKSGIANACPNVERELDIQGMVSEENIQRLAQQHDEMILSFENVSLFFLLLYSFSMCVLAVTALSFPLNMQILHKEISNGWYTMPRFVMAKTLADLPIELSMPAISISIAYVITGQPSSYMSWRLLAVTAVMILCSLISQTQGLLFGAYFMNNVQAAVFVSQASTLPCILLSGFTTRVSELPSILKWLSFGSIYRLGIESIVAVRYGFGMCPCNEDLVKNSSPHLVGIPDQLRSLMRYYMDSYAASGTTDDTATTVGTNSSSTVFDEKSIITAVGNATDSPLSGNTRPADPDIFEKIASTLSRANTYGVDIHSCQDVRPFIMSAREVDESTLFNFLFLLLGILIALKILLFLVVRVRTG